MMMSVKISHIGIVQVSCACTVQLVYMCEHRCYDHMSRVQTLETTQTLLSVGVWLSQR